MTVSIFCITGATVRGNGNSTSKERQAIEEVSGSSRNCQKKLLPLA